MNVATNVSGLSSSVNTVRTGGENSPLILENRPRGAKCCGCRPSMLIQECGTSKHGATNVILAIGSVFGGALATTFTSIDCNRRPGKAMGALTMGFACGAAVLVSACLCQFHAKHLEPGVSKKKAIGVKLMTAAIAAAGIALSVFSAFTLANCKEP
jgi:hypothetical protein